ncbi:MAG: aldo/keto reductase [Anaerolineae bacterium]|nr:aldo/keto reductase [Anaerolineae bacterium]
MTVFPRSTIAKAGLEVPRIALGCAHIGKFGREEAIGIVHSALELGIDFLDTAPLYKTEAYMGEALKGVPRDSYILATKIGRLPDGRGGFIFDYTRDGVLRSLENSLNALKLDRVDILHIHDPDVEDKYEEALHHGYPVLDELRSQGVVSPIGPGMNQWEMELAFSRAADFDCFLLAGRHTLLEQTALAALQEWRERGIGVFAGGIFNSGILATGDSEIARYNYEVAPPDIRAKARKLEGICKRYRVPLNAAAVQFVQAHPAYNTLVVGADRVHHVADNLAALKFEIPQAFWQELVDVGLVDAAAPLPDSPGAWQ